MFVFFFFFFFFFDLNSDHIICFNLGQEEDDWNDLVLGHERRDKRNNTKMSRLMFFFCTKLFALLGV